MGYQCCAAVLLTLPVHVTVSQSVLLTVVTESTLVKVFKTSKYPSCSLQHYQGVSKSIFQVNLSLNPAQVICQQFKPILLMVLGLGLTMAADSGHKTSNS